jgi:hypothetical protein
MKIVNLFNLLILSLLTISCIRFNPILLNNQNYQNLHEDVVKYEISLCQKEADEFANNEIASESYYNVTDGLTRSFSDAVSQSILGLGNPKTNLLNNTIRTSGSATSNTIKSYQKTKNNPDANIKNYIVNCLGRRGLVVIGWK